MPLEPASGAAASARRARRERPHEQEQPAALETARRSSPIRTRARHGLRQATAGFEGAVADNSDVAGDCRPVGDRAATLERVDDESGGERARSRARPEATTRCDVAGDGVAGDDVAGNSSTTEAGALPAPRPHRMGNQRRITWRVFGYHYAEPDAQPRGNHRYIMCDCGWLVQLNATGRAYARLHPRPAGANHRAGEVGLHEAGSACTNYVCTGRADHRRERRRHRDRQTERREAINDGRAVLIYLTGEHPAPTAPPPGCHPALRWIHDPAFA